MVLYQHLLKGNQTTADLEGWQFTNLNDFTVQFVTWANSIAVLPMDTQYSIMVNSNIMTRQYTSLPPHRRVMLEVDILFLDVENIQELIYFYFDGVEVY